MINEHEDMQSALGSHVVNVKHNEQEFEDELANLLSEDGPVVSSPGKHNIPGIISVTCNIFISIILKFIF